MGAGLVVRRVYLVLTDHSIAGVWFTKREAIAAARLRIEQASKPIVHIVRGPFVLAANAQDVEVG